MKRFLCSLLTLIALVSLTSTAPCTPVNQPATFTPDLHTLLNRLLDSNEEIQNYRHQVKKAEEMLKQSRAGRYPTVDLYGDTGWEKVEKEFENDTDGLRHEVTLRGRQLLTDFGRTRNAIKRDETILSQTHARLESVRQQMMREGIAAYINIVSSREKLKTARYSEKRIKQLTGIEVALVQKGAGLTSDVLQAKSQLAGAMALTVEAKGELNIARNRFQSVFYHYPSLAEVEQFTALAYPLDHLPVTLEKAILNAGQKQSGTFNYKTRSEHRRQRGGFVPVLPVSHRPPLCRDGKTPTITAAFPDIVTSTPPAMEFNYNIFRGGMDRAGIKSALAKKNAAHAHLQYAMKLVTEQVRNSWDQLTILKQKNELLNQQIDILKNFLDLARKERKMGTRSLLDVLNGEVNYINAQGNAIAAREDTKIAAYNLLFSMGRIHLNFIQRIRILFPQHPSESVPFSMKEIFQASLGKNRCRPLKFWYPPW